jgi:photosystem II stability/assembly factor-like uncharacterized protein
VWSVSFDIPVEALELQDEITTLTQSIASWQILNHRYMQDETVLRDVVFLNATHGWVVGQNETGLGGGIILRTTDGGDSWELQFYNRSQRFDAIDINDDLTIWVTCKGGLVKSNDSGQSWSSVSVIDGQAGLGCVRFFNRTHGWTSTMGDVYKTVDGGLTWYNVTTWQFNDFLRSMHFISPTRIWAIGVFGIYSTNDGGIIWEAKYPRGGWKISFVSDNEGWAVADDLLLHMTDGEIWVEQALPRKTLSPLEEAPYYTDILFKDQNHGWIVGLETPVVFTPDGGMNWYAQEVPEEVDRRMMGVDFVNLTHGWAVGFGGYILRTVNGDGLGTLLPLENSVSSFLVIIEISVAAVVICSVVMIFVKRRKSAFDSLADTTDAAVLRNLGAH